MAALAPVFHFAGYRRRLLLCRHEHGEQVKLFCLRLCSYFAAYFALCGCVAFTPRVGVLWTLALVGERALSGLAVAAFPLAKNTGLAHTFATAADRVRVRQVLAALCAMLAVGLTALGGWALVLAAGCVFARYYVVAKKQFGGATGDLAGWFLQKCEIWMLAALAACQWLGVL
jgi:adenosylcobinamide-GDP ribazoletransferase